MQSHGKYIDEKTIFVRKVRGTQGVVRYTFTTRMGHPLAVAHVAGGQARLYFGPHEADSALEAFAVDWLKEHRIPVMGVGRRSNKGKGPAHKVRRNPELIYGARAVGDLLYRWGQDHSASMVDVGRAWMSGEGARKSAVSGASFMLAAIIHREQLTPEEKSEVRMLIKALDRKLQTHGTSVQSLRENKGTKLRQGLRRKTNPERPKFKALEVYMDHLGSVYTRSQWQVSSSFEEWGGRFVPHTKATFRAKPHALSFAKKTMTDAVDSGFAPKGVVLEGGNEVFSYSGKKAGRQRKVNPRTRSTPKRRPGLRVKTNPHMMVRDLPEGIKRVLKEVGYGTKDIEVEPRATYSPSAMSGAGLKAFVGVVDLGTDRYKIEWGSWGGPNISEQRQVDLDTSVYPMPYNGAVVKGHRGGGHPVHAHVEIHPENLQKLLPSGPTEELSEAEKTALLVIKSYKAGSRRDGFSRNDLGKYNEQNPVIRRLAQAGLVKVTGTGIQITMAGKNVAETIKGIYV